MKVAANYCSDSSGCSVHAWASMVIDIITIIMDGHFSHRCRAGWSATLLAMMLDETWYLIVFAIIFRDMLISPAVGTLELAGADCRSTEPQAALARRAAGGTEPNRLAIQQTVYDLVKDMYLITCSLVPRPGGRRSESLYGQPPVDASCRCTKPPRLPSRGAVGGAEPSWFVRHGLGTGQELGTSSAPVARWKLPVAVSLSRKVPTSRPWSSCRHSLEPACPACMRANASWTDGQV